jgi:aryl-alcohol dehydrogenase-like predicted oxidoreductase
MERITIPGTTLAVAPLCLGVADMGTKIERHTAFAMLDAYLDAGGNFLDTALVYADWVPGERSVSEKLLGEWLQSRGAHGRVVLATKGAHPPLTAMHQSRLAPADIAHDIAASRAHLRADTIDLYWLHRDDPARSVGEIVEALNEHIGRGDIRYFACSNWRVERIGAAQAYAQAHGLSGFVANQMLWNAAVVNDAALGDASLVAMDDALWEYHRDSGLAAIPFSSQANGLFTKLIAGQEDRLRPGWSRVYPEIPNRARAERINQISRQTGLSATQIVLGYLRGQPFATIPVVGPQSLTQLADTLSAAGVRLSAEQIRFIDEAQ